MDENINLRMSEMQANRTYLQIRARRSPLPVAKSFPDGLGATEMTTTTISIGQAARSEISHK